LSDERRKGKKRNRKEKKLKNSLADIRIANHPFPGTFSSAADQNAPSTTTKTAKKHSGTSRCVFQTQRKTSDMNEVLISFFF